MSETVEQFFRIHIENDRDGRRLAQALNRLTPPPPGRTRPGQASRPVVFSGIASTPRSSTFASEGAFTMLAALGVPVILDAAPVRWRELPDGLMLVVGDASDRDRYERRAG